MPAHQMEVDAAAEEGVEMIFLSAPLSIVVEERKARGAPVHPHGAWRARRERPEEPGAREGVRVRPTVRFRHLRHRAGYRPSARLARNGLDYDAQKAIKWTEDPLPPRSPASSRGAT